MRKSRTIFLISLRKDQDRKRMLSKTSISAVKNFMNLRHSTVWMPQMHPLDLETYVTLTFHRTLIRADLGFFENLSPPISIKTFVSNGKVKGKFYSY